MKHVEMFENIFLSTVYSVFFHFFSLNTKNTIRAGVQRSHDHISFERECEENENKGENHKTVMGRDGENLLKQFGTLI